MYQAVVNFLNHLITVSQQYPSLLIAVAFLLTFAKSCAFISLVIPGTSGLLILGPLSAGNSVLFILMWSAASTGAIAGFWLSWWLGVHHRHRTNSLRWYKPAMREKSTMFLLKWGIYSVFLGRFISLFRATIPLACGIAGVRLRDFQLANISSALIWTFILLAPGVFTHGLDL